jgi:hypothetical protein
MERITGPYDGFYIATCARELGGSTPGYVAWAKVCRGKPDNYAQAHHCATVPGDTVHPTPQEAMNAAERQARQQAGMLATYAFARPAQAQA